MTILLSQVNATVLGIDDKVSVNISVESEPHYGYGYGRETGASDFFDVFGLDGDEYGILVEQLDSIPTTPNFYGWGFEYSTAISGDIRTKKVTVTVVPEQTVDSSKTYKLLINVRGEGYSNVFEGTTTSGDTKSFVFYVYDFDLPTSKKYIMLGEDGVILGNGITELINKDTFLDIIVEVLGTTQSYPKLFVKASAVAEQDAISQSLKVTGTVN